MHTQQLLCFVCVADRLNFTKAAEELYLSTPTVTHHIKTLENELQTTLFIRNSKMVQLTKSGKEFYQDAKEILTRIEIAEKKIQRIVKPSTTSLKIGCTSNAELPFLKKPLELLHQKYPDIYPQICVNDYFTLKNLFENGQIDFLLSTKNIIRKTTKAPFLKLKTIINYAIFLKTSELSKKKELQFEDLENERLITLHPKIVPFDYANKMREKMIDHGLTHLDIHCENDQSGILLAECGYGIAIFPEFCIPALSRQLVKRPFEKEHFSLEYGLTYHPVLKDDCVKEMLLIFRQMRQDIGELT